VVHRLLPLVLVACATSDKPEPCPEGSERRADGLCYLLDADPKPDTSTPDSTDDPPDSGGDDGGSGGGGLGGDAGSDDGEEEPGPTLGDPIRTTGSVTGEPVDDALYEHMDAAMIDDEHAILVGFGGHAIARAADGELVAIERGPRGLRVATDGQLAAIATRTDGLVLVDVSAPASPVTLGTLPLADLPDPHEDLAVDGGRILLGAHGSGAVLLASDGTRLATLPAEDAFAVALQGDRALITDGAELELWDLSTPASPELLSSAPLPGEGRDLSWSGTHVAVGMGGRGTAVFALDDTTLTERAVLFTPGSALSVSIDEDRLWIGAWEVTALAALDAEPPVVLSHEDPSWSAMAVAGRGGRAVVADWFASTSLQAVDGVRGPELVAPGDLYFDRDALGPETLRLENAGTEPLVVDLRVDSTRFVLATPTVVLDPLDIATVTVTPQPTWDGSTTTLQWTSDDPDEPSGSLSLAAVDQGVGSAQVDFTLPGFQLPDTSLQTYSLADARGKVLVLIYWAYF
jgi:hypothetical protein